MSKNKRLVLIAIGLVLLGVVFLLLNLRYVAIFLLTIGITCLVLRATILLAEKNSVLCPACGFAVTGARKLFKLKGVSKCPKCGTLIFTHSNQ